jgi:hypothetical protein
MSYVEGKRSDVGVWEQGFFYATDEDMEIGKLVRLSGDMTVSAIKAGTGAVDILSTGADAPIGVCEQNRNAAIRNSDPDIPDRVMVRIIGGRFQGESTIICGGAPIDAGDLLPMAAGASMLALTSGTEGDEITVLVP